MEYSEATLDALRTEGDPTLDPIMRAMLERRDLPQVNALLRDVVRNVDAIPAGLPPELASWLREHARLPDGVDRARMDRASRFFVDHGLSLGTLLGLASLLECYAAKKGVKALHATDRMGYGSAERRVGETIQFVLDVMQPGAFEPGGRAMPSILKVRMMHSASRLLIGGLPDWDARENGVPVNQEDLVATLLTFGYTPLVHLRKLGFAASDEEAEDFLYFWRIVGERMGVRADAIPRSVREAETCLARVQERHFAPCPESRDLTRALFEVYARLVPGAGVLTGLMPGLARYLVGDAVCDMLGVPESAWKAVAEKGKVVFRLFSFLQQRSTVVNDAVNRLGVSIITGGATSILKGGRAAFTIPSELRRAWRLPPEGAGARAARVVRDVRAGLAERGDEAIDRLLEVAILIASVDGDIDDFEVETLLEIVGLAAESEASRDRARAWIASHARGFATAKERAEKTLAIASRLRAADLVQPALTVATVVAYADSGLASQEREALQQLAGAAHVSPAKLDALVDDVYRRIEAA